MGCLYKRNEKIDTLKGICIIFVIITHSGWSAEHRLQFLFPFWIDQAVPIFMIISGYVLGKSFQSRKILSFEDAYNIKYLCERVVRFLSPFLIIFFIEIIFELKRQSLYELCNGNIFNGILSLFIVGGVGPGAYYVPLMIQLIFIYPLIYFGVKRYDYLAVIKIFIICFIWEYLKFIYKMSDYEYRLLIVRYVPGISVGYHLAIGKTIPKRATIVVTFCLGLTWLIIDQYYCHIPFFFNKAWAGTSCLDVLYIVPLICCYLEDRVRVLKLYILSMLGKASYHIFLFQKFFYTFLYSYVNELINSKIQRLIFYLIICIAGGMILYQMDTILSKIAVKHSRRNIENIDAGLSALFKKMVKNR